MSHLENSFPVAFCHQQLNLPLPVYPLDPYQNPVCQPWTKGGGCRSASDPDHLANLHEQGTPGGSVRATRTCSRPSPGQEQRLEPGIERKRIRIRAGRMEGLSGVAGVSCGPPESGSWEPKADPPGAGPCCGP